MLFLHCCPTRCMMTHARSASTLAMIVSRQISKAPPMLPLSRVEHLAAVAVHNLPWCLSSWVVDFQRQNSACLAPLNCVDSVRNTRRQVSSAVQPRDVRPPPVESSPHGTSRRATPLRTASWPARGGACRRGARCRKRSGTSRLRLGACAESLGVLCPRTSGCGPYRRATSRMRCRFSHRSAGAPLQ